MRYTSRNSTSTSGGGYWGYEAVKLLPKIVKMTAWRFGISCQSRRWTADCGHAPKSYSTTTRYFIRDWIAGQPHRPAW